MMDEMANHATRVRRHIERHGQDTVERFIDACLSIEHLIDPHSMFMRREPPRSRREEKSTSFEPDKLPAKDYMDPFINPELSWSASARRSRRSSPSRRSRRASRRATCCSS